MLHEKDQLFNWVVPVKSAGRRLTSDFKVNIKHHYLYISNIFLNKNFPDIDKENVKIAFLLEGPKAFAVINPTNGVPFYKFTTAHRRGNKSPTPFLTNKHLAGLFKKRFFIENQFQEFSLEKFENINGMIFYQIIPEKS